MNKPPFIISGKEFTLTESRILILNCYCIGCVQISDYQDCEVETIYSHMKSIRLKTGLGNCRELERFALAHNLRNNGYIGDDYLFEGYELVPWEQKG